ncbi:MAG: heme lyase CcmF/NrfE family subunit [Alphaproteobacteria bacterium]|nr:heme lyase CcmF/NrfE family subunit [Alphaproteobacteria bacterium]
MINEIGHFALVLAFVLSVLTGTVPLVALRRGWHSLAKLAIPATLIMAAAVILSFAALVSAFLASDFSVALVASHSHSAKPWIYKFSGTWGNHEGSLLLWIVILALFAALLAMGGRGIATGLKIRTLAVQALTSAGFLAFCLFTSNPFARLDPPPLDGRGLNPILQDPGLALHPPTLYLGYVGLSMAFSFAVAGLIEGRIDRDWAHHMRPWVTAAWCALTAGIALGSWWAYYELGWGGWWFWDPVENASLMPWLAATALLHSTIVVEQRGALKSWTVLLAILAFSLSLVGTFIVRSGLLTSVHSFASDPARGVFILGILLVAVGIPLLLFAIRGPQITSRSDFALISREGALILNNFLLTSATIVVLVGTFYPLALEMVTGARITVGPPYFDATFNPIMGALMAAMGVGPLLAWRRGIIAGMRKIMLMAGATMLVLLLAVVMASAAIGSGISIAGMAGLALLFWLGAGILVDIIYRLKPGKAGIAARAAQLPTPLIGMWIAHFGMVIFLAGALGNGLFATEVVVRATPGDSVDVAGRQMTLRAVEARQGPNYVTETAVIDVREDGRLLAVMTPEKRFYTAERQTTTEAAIRPRFGGDDYAVLGDGTDATGYTLRLYRKPLVSWIWAGAGLMAIGGAVAAIGRVRRRQVPVVARTSAIGADQPARM